MYDMHLQTPVYPELAAVSRKFGGASIDQYLKAHSRA
jgi:hypothetical protein